MTQTFTVRSTSDAVALVPRILGFVPERSLVLITDRPTARVDLPVTKTRETYAQLVDAAVKPIMSHRPRFIIALALDDEDPDWADLLAIVAEATASSGATVITASVNGATYRDAGLGEPHPLGPGPLRVVGENETAKTATMTRRDLVAHYAPAAAPAMPETLSALDRLEIDGVDRLITSVMADKDTAKTALELWSETLRSMDPTNDGPRLIEDVALIAAWSAYRCGNGAVTWICLDQAHQTHPAARRLTQLLNDAVDPDTVDLSANALV